MKTRIMFICAGFGGGIGKIVRFVSNICVSEFESVILLHRGRESDNDIPPQGVTEIVIPNRQHMPMPVWRCQQIIDIRQNIAQVKPDIICCFGSEMAVMLSLAMVGKRHLCKVILAERGDPYTLPRIWKILSRWAFTKADRCVFQLEKQGLWYGQKVMAKSCVIPNAFIPTGVIPNVKSKQNKCIVSVGRFVYEKRYEILIQAFAKVHSKHPDFKLVLYGEGPYRSIYEELINNLKLNQFIEMPGYTKNSMSAIKDASVFVLSSLYEGMPNTLIEALAVGIPCVATNCTPGGPDYLTRHGSAGLLVPIDDVNAMSEAICLIIESPELASELSRKGKEVVRLLDPNKISNMWLSLFNDVATANNNN